MNDIFEVEYQIVDRGTTYPNGKREVTVKPGSDILGALKKELNKDRHSMDLSAKFQVAVIRKEHVGWT